MYGWCVFVSLGQTSETHCSHSVSIFVSDLFQFFLCNMVDIENLPSRWDGATAANGCGITCGNCPYTAG